MQRENRQPDRQAIAGRDDRVVVNRVQEQVCQGKPCHVVVVFLPSAEYQAPGVHAGLQRGLLKVGDYLGAVAKQP